MALKLARHVNWSGLRHLSCSIECHLILSSCHPVISRQSDNVGQFGIVWAALNQMFLVVRMQQVRLLNEQEQVFILNT